MNNIDNNKRVYSSFKIDSELLKFRLNKYGKFAIRAFYFHLSMLLLAYTYNIIKISFNLSYRKDMIATDKKIIWQWFMYFSMQSNIIFLYYLYLQKTNAYLITKKFVDRLRLISLSMLSMTSIFWFQFFVDAKGNQEQKDFLDWIFSIYLHLFSIALAFYDFYYNKKKLGNSYFVRLSYLLRWSLYYFIVYVFVIVFFIQLVDPGHWSVYGAVTNWYDSTKKKDFIMTPMMLFLLWSINFLIYKINNWFNI
jgi:hypothetical protein